MFTKYLKTLNFIALFGLALASHSLFVPDLFAQTCNPDEDQNITNTLNLTPPIVDVLFVMDITSSMGSVHNALKTKINDAITGIRALNTDADIAFGLVSHQGLRWSIYKFSGRLCKCSW